MSPVEFRLALEALGLSQSAFGRMIQTEPRQVRRWLAGDAKVPGPVIIIVRFMRRMQKDHGRDALLEFFGAAKVRPKRQKDAA
jgi:DNA-binding transcriptional regulator YiaG